MNSPFIQPYPPLLSRELCTARGHTRALPFAVLVQLGFHTPLPLILDKTWATEEKTQRDFYS